MYGLQGAFSLQGRIEFLTEYLNALLLPRTLVKILGEKKLREFLGLNGKNFFRYWQQTFWVDDLQRARVVEKTLANIVKPTKQYQSSAKDQMSRSMIIPTQISFWNIKEPNSLNERVDHFLELVKLLHENKDAELAHWCFRKFEFLNVAFNED